LINKAASNDVSKKFEFAGYEFWFNSPFASRGVGIAIKKSAGLVKNNIFMDRTGNILAMELAHSTDPEKNTILTVVSLYGPNDNSGEFYSDLERILRNAEKKSLVLGGDWNSTWDSGPPETNIDVLNMRSIPSRARTERVHRIANMFSLLEPYRYLYPVRKDFTYIPNAIAQNNRSRIDYFLVNNEISEFISDTGIRTEKLTNLFDHKSVFLNVGRIKKMPDRNKIKDCILENKVISLVVEISVKEAYLNNADRNAVPNYTINTLKSEMGRIYSKLAQASDLEISAIKNGPINVATQNLINNLLQDSVDIALTLPALEYFESLPLAVSPACFLEGLIMSVKNEILSKQSAIYKTKNFRKKVLKEKIWDLKKNYNLNFEEIGRLETTLNSLVEDDLKSELAGYKIFERLNQEKITPHFMNLVRSDNKQNINLSSIHDNQGIAFASESDRENYISDFYSELYKKTNDVPNTDTCIYDFLGNVADNPEVLASKLTDAEKDQIDTDLDILEFDKAVTEAKTNSAPGIDGISNKFIKKFWHFFRSPLYNYTVHCLENGELTENFRTAKIRLIPKKADPKKISNWRPISLLSCFYKIISRVLTNRLKTVSDKITRIGQKGYSNSKWCQEVVISIFDSIFDAKSRGKSGCIVSLDIKKAFDSISHDFMVKALRFFNFGEKFIGWIKTICTNRKACIILDSGGTGKQFTLERGNAQGDVISPFIFNICYQVLLFKIEFNLQIESIGLPQVLLEDPDLVGAVNRVSYRSKKVFTFADDCNILAAYKPETIREIINVLDNFGKISGLICNVNKSHILPVGFNPVTTQELSDLGFTISNEITVLGFQINNNMDIFRKNATGIINKLRSQSRIWVRYNLSLPGRLNICKSMFYSQLNYAGSIIPITGNEITEMENIIYNFASGNLRISKERVFLPVSQGGLGLFNVKQFLDAQLCSWVRRARIVDQDWKARIIGTGTGNIYRVSDMSVEGNQYPITHNICRAFASFREKFTTVDNNYKTAFIVNNSALTTGLRSKNIITEAVITEGTIDAAKKRNLANLKISDLITNRQKVSKIEFNRRHGTNLPDNVWQTLDKIRSAALTKYGSDDYKPVKNIETFFSEWKRGSKKIRNILCQPRAEYIPHNIIKFAENTEIVIGIDNSKYLNKLWNRSYLSNDVRVFIFKLHNNTLPVNTILSHFVRDIGRNCTFCDILRVPEEDDESIFHLFFSCPTSERLRHNFYSWISNGTLLNVSRRQFFGEFREPNNFYNELLNICTKLFKKFIWDSRVRKTIPAIENLKNFICDEVSTMAKCSKKFKTILQGSGIDRHRIFNFQDF
jgi:exonuclease III